MTLQDKLDALREDFENGRFPLVPTSDQLDTMQRATRALIDSGQAESALGAGDTAPDFELEDAAGHLVSSRRLLAEGPLVLTFYRGVWCPYCNHDLQALEEVRAPIEERAQGWSRYLRRLRPTAANRNAITSSASPF